MSGASSIAAERPSLTNGSLAPIVDGRASEFHFRIVDDDASFSRFPGRDPAPARHWRQPSIPTSH
jgi:hypothetical protein